MTPFTLHTTSRLPSPPTPSSASPSASPSPSRPIGRTAGPERRGVGRCRVCGFSEVRTDEVVDLSALLLAECPRCEHRWTEPATGPRVVRPPARRVEETASAA
jgi:hypothetical protein